MSKSMSESWDHFAHRQGEAEDMTELSNQTLKVMYSDDYMAALHTIVSTRSTVLQIFPGLAVLSIFANLTSNSPLFVHSKRLHLNLPEMLCKEPEKIARQMEVEYTRTVNSIRTKDIKEDDFVIDMPDSIKNAPSSNRMASGLRRRIEEANEFALKHTRTCLSQEPLLVKEWVVKLNTVSVFVRNSRLLIFLYELGQFCLIMALLFGLKEDASDASVRGFVAMTVLLLVPMATCAALDCYVIIGKVLSITDDDLAHFAQSFRDLTRDDLAEDEEDDDDDDDDEGLGDIDYIQNPLTASRASMESDDSDLSSDDCSDLSDDSYDTDSDSDDNDL